MQHHGLGRDASLFLVHLSDGQGARRAEQFKFSPHTRHMIHFWAWPWSLGVSAVSGCWWWIECLQGEGRG
jgi:hypothetical protein